MRNKKKLIAAVLVTVLTCAGIPIQGIGMAEVYAAENAPGTTDSATSDAVVVEPVKKLDFTKGLKEYNLDEDIKLDIIKTENLLVQKTDPNEKEAGDKFDSNDIMVMIGSTSYYYRATVSNQPSSHVDAERGSVLYMGKTVNIPAVAKEKSAAIPNDDKSTELLDKEIPVPEGEDKTIQPAMTVRSELKFNTPLKGLTDNYSVAMWINIPAVEGVENSLAGKWHHVAASKSGDNYAYYVDGAATENSQSAALLAAWATQGYSVSGAALVTGDSIYIGGYTTSAALFNDSFGITDANAEIMLDNISFYNQALTADEVSAIYNTESETSKPVSNIIKSSDLKDISELKAADEGDVVSAYTSFTAGDKISSSKETVNGAANSDVLKVPENRRPNTMTGAYISNPFAGKNIDGATISFWTKQAPRESVKDSTGEEDTPVVSFIDQKKHIHHEKSGADGDAFSMLSFMNTSTTVFKEGFSDNAVWAKLKNNYSVTITEEDRAKYDVKDWYYVTLVVSNAGIKVYINGDLYENNLVDEKGKSTAAGYRFCDGDFQRADDAKDIATKYNIFGIANNQYATALMDFMTQTDVNLYFGFIPNSATLNVRTNPTYYSGIRTFDMALSDVQVKELFNDNTVYDDKSGGSTDVTGEGGNISDDFEIDENGVLTKYNGEGGDVVIPDGVTEIGNYSFSDCIGLKSITIPEGVTSIGDYAFYDSSLENIIGKKGSYAENYAKENGYTFVAIDDDNTGDDTSTGYEEVTKCGFKAEMTVDGNIATVTIKLDGDCKNFDFGLMYDADKLEYVDGYFTDEFRDAFIKNGYGVFAVSDRTAQSFAIFAGTANECTFDGEALIIEFNIKGDEAVPISIVKDIKYILESYNEAGATGTLKEFIESDAAPADAPKPVEIIPQIQIPDKPGDGDVTGPSGDITAYEEMTKCKFDAKMKIEEDVATVTISLNGDCTAFDFGIMYDSDTMEFAGWNITSNFKNAFCQEAAGITVAMDEKDESYVVYAGKGNDCVYNGEALIIKFKIKGEEATPVSIVKDSKYILDAYSAAGATGTLEEFLASDKAPADAPKPIQIIPQKQIPDKPDDGDVTGPSGNVTGPGGDTSGPSGDTTPDAAFLAGDVDCNNTVNLDDAKAVLKLAVGIETKSPIIEQGMKNADYDQSGKIDLKDATYTLKTAVGVQFTLPDKR